jgi:hypothetical protein
MKLERTFNKENILSAFEVTGISPFNAYQTRVMQEFMEKAQNANWANSGMPLREPITAASWCQDHNELLDSLWELTKDPSVQPDELQKALTDTLKLAQGANA